MDSIGICSSLFGRAGPLNYETRTLIEESGHAFDSVVQIDPRKVAYAFERAGSGTVVTLGGSEEASLDHLSALVVRNTSGCEQAVALLTRTLRSLGCEVLDPDDRFNGFPASKLLTTLDRHERHVGTDTYIAFDVTSALATLGHLAEAQVFPLIIKPMQGRQGKGVTLMRDYGAAIAHVRNFFDTRTSADEAILLQRYMNFEMEYRAIVVGGRCVGVVRKERDKVFWRIPANTAQGAQLIVSADSEVARFAENSVSNDGIYGADIGWDGNGDKSLHLIEANYAPLWEPFDIATNGSVAREIVAYAMERVRSRSERVAQT